MPESRPVCHDCRGWLIELGYVTEAGKAGRMIARPAIPSPVPCLRLVPPPLPPGAAPREIPEALQALVASGPLDEAPPRGSPCLVDDCGCPVWTRGLCSTHYTLASRHGLLDSIAPTRSRWTRRTQFTPARRAAAGGSNV